MRKKLWIGIIATILVVAAGMTLGACGGGKDAGTFSVTYAYHDGVTPDAVATVQSGETAVEPRDPERSGYRFRYWALTGETGPYDFTAPVTADLTLNAQWEEIVPEPVTYTIKWTAFEGGVYAGRDGAALPTVGAQNATVSFKVELSPYYTHTAVVKINRKSAEPGADGYYTVTLTRDTTVEVEGIALDRTPFEGKGTQAEPYLIRTAGQMKQLAEHVNLGETAYAKAHYRLENDIDFKNYEYTVIGNRMAARFYGFFDGNGHTLSNMRITEAAVETVSDGNTESHRAFVGVFGMVGVVSTDPYSATVNNLHVAGLNVDVEEEASVFAGGIIGYGIGATLWNCAVEGNLRVKTTGGYFSFTGGLVGIHQSSMDTVNGIPYYANTMYCTTDVNIVTEDFANAAGGLVGYLLTDGGATAFVINSYARGNVAGAMYTGGIVGQMSENSSVANVYATGDVSARTAIGGEEYAFAGAGGIVGYAENNTVIQNSFATGAYAAYSSAGEQYEFADGIAGITIRDGALKITSRSLIVHNTYYAEGGLSGQYDFAARETLQNVLGWQECDWRFDPADLDYPMIQEENIPAENVLRLVYGDETVNGAAERTVTLTQDGNAYLPLSYWRSRGEIPAAPAADAHTDGTVLRAYGLFFDAACTDPVPEAYILAKDETFYYGWSDYRAVAGVYRFDALAEEAELELTDAGIAYYRHGAIRQTFSFTYGNVYGDETAPRITFTDAYFCSLYGGTLDWAATDYLASLENGVLTVRDATFFPAGAELYAYADHDLLGVWYAGDATYEFRVNRTCTLDGRDAVYTIAGETVTVTAGDLVYTGTLSVRDTLTLSAGAETIELSRVDELLGVWESEISHNELAAYEFDGKGNYRRFRFRYESYYAPNDAGQQVLKQRKLAIGAPEAGTYRYADGAVAFDDGARVGAFDENGLLRVTENAYTEVFGRENGFRGVWVDEWINDGEGYTLTLSGIGKDGTGTMTDSNGFRGLYEVMDDGMLTLYVGTSMYGMGNYQANNLPGDDRSKQGGMLLCAIYTPSSGMLTDDYNLAHVDLFAGSWTSADDTLGELDFNGYGDYDLRLQTSTHDWIVEGYVTVGGTRVRYYNESADRATFVFGGKTYAVTFAQGQLSVSDGTSTLTYVRRDRLSEYVWLAADGAKIVFNGRGEIGRGRVTLTAADGTAVNADYTAEGDRAVITAAGVSYTAVRDAASGYLELSDGETSVRYGIDNGFTGLWAVQGGGTIRIGELSESYRGAGEYSTGDETKAVSLRLASGYALAMTYTDPQDAERSFTFYLLLLEGGEMLLSPYPEPVEGTYLVCVPPDELRGMWTGADSTLTFDGLGHSQYAYGRATLTQGGQTETYYYSQADGAWALYGVSAAGAPAARYIVETGAGADAAYSFAKDGVTIGLYDSDGMFGVTVVDETGATYRFNGLSGYGRGRLESDAATYAYYDPVQHEDGSVTVKLTDSENRCYTGLIVTEIDADGHAVNRLTLTPCESAAA